MVIKEMKNAYSIMRILTMSWKEFSKILKSYQITGSKALKKEIENIVP